MTFATEQKHVSNVGLALKIDWQRRMGIIAQRGLPLFLPPRAKAELRAEQWRMAGECLCGAGGGKLRSFCNTLMRLIKFQCLVGSRNRATLENGTVVLSLLPRNLPRSCVEDWRPVTLHRPYFASRQRPSHGFTWAHEL